MRKSHLKGRYGSSAARGAKSAFVLAAAVASLASVRTVVAVTATWLDTDNNNNWSDGNNWTSAPTPPGDDSGAVTTNTDEAVFNSTPSSNVVNLDGANGWNLQNILFDSSNATNFDISATANVGNSLLLTNAGSITVDSTVTAGTRETINAPIVLEGTSYTFDSNSTTSSAGLLINGNITGAAAGITNITLSGANAGSSAIVGSITNGAATTMNLVMQGTGIWELGTTASPSGVNTYNGATTVDSGTLAIENATALPSTTDVLVNGSTAVFKLSATPTFPTIDSLTLENGGIATQSNTSDGVNIDSNTGPGLTINAATQTTTITTKLEVNFTGTVVGNDGVLLINSPTTPGQKIGTDTLNLGNLSRTFNIEQGGQSIAGQTVNSTDLEIDGVITSTGGGIIKAGAGTLKLQNAAETFTGAVEIQAGQLKLIGGTTPNPFIGTNPLLIDGGTLNINGANATFGAATFTSGSTLLSSSATTAAIIAPSFTFSVSTAGSFAMTNVMADDGSPSPVVSNGAGTVNLSNANTYSGGTTISAGTFIVSNSATIGGSATGTGNVTLNGGTFASGTVGSISGDLLAGSAAHTIAPGGIGAVGTLSIGGLTSSSLTTLDFELGSGATVNTNGSVLLLGSGTVSIGSGTQIAISGTPTVGDDYRIIGGTIAAVESSESNFVLPTVGGVGFIFNNTVDAGFIDLQAVTVGPVSLTWNDASADNLWNTTSSNWNNGSGSTTYADPAAVTFNDNNGGNYNVTLNTTVNPASVTVNNTSGSYTISGTGRIAGTAALTKSGNNTLTLKTVNTYTGGTNVSAGTLVVGATGALPSGAVNITGGTLQLAASTGLATVTTLAISGNGTFDVNNNHVIINYGSGTDPIASIAALLKTGFNGGHWNGAGGITSTAAATNTLSYGLGYADSADAGNPANLSSGNIEIKYTLLGDANLDGTVNGIDFGILAANFNKGVTGWDKGDFNYDNVVSGIDFGDLAANFNKGASGASIGEPAYEDPAIVAFAQANGLMADVPEPASMGLIAAGAVGLMARRRRNPQRQA